jgi:ABC-type multidrug transport system fused ATPase/permease subunit
MAHLHFDRLGRRMLGLGLVASLGQAALLIPIPLVIRQVFDHDLHRGGSLGVILGGAAVLALYVGGSSLALASRYAVLRATKSAIADLRAALAAKLFALPKSFHDGVDPRQLHAVVVQDSERLDVVANAAVGQVLPAAVASLGLAVLALALNPELFCLLVAVVPPLVVVKRLLGGRVRARTRRWQIAFDNFSAATQTALRARTLAEVRAADEFEIGRLSDTAAVLSEAGVQMAWRQSLLSISQGSILAVATVLVLVVGGTAVADGSMSTGDLISFFSVVALLQGQLSPIVAALPQVIAGRESLARLTDFLDRAEPPAYQGTKRIAWRGAIELRRVSFGYGTIPLLRDIDLTVAPGEHVVVLGPNGAGKTSLAGLILGLYRPSSGQLLADGTPYEQLDVRVLRTSLGVLLQDPVILPGTVLENIAYGRPQATPAEIKRAAALAGAAGFIAQLPGTYDAAVGADGGLLSGGQRQRLALARALLGDPRLLILDEPTTHLDVAAIAALAAALDELPQRPAVVTISHDEELARHADRVVHLRDGLIATPALAAISGRAG